MRWLSFAVAGRQSFGIVKGEGVVDVGAMEPRFDSIKAVLAADRLDELGRAAITRSVDHPLSAVQFHPVIPNPDKILCVGLNYKSHQQETGRGGEPYPTIFTRFAASQMGHNEPMWKPKETDRLDYEGEIAMIIGRGGRRISKENALQHVAGFAPYNDGSVRDWQRHTSQFTPGKNFQHSGGFGPWMMTVDEIGDLNNMEITTRLNGEVMQQAKSSLLVFGFAELIAYCSTFTELVAGDVIVTGTPGGVGSARNPPLFMKPGDRIEVEVKPIGTLSNPIVAEG